MTTSETPKGTAQLYDAMAAAWERYGEPLTAQFVPPALEVAKGRPGERLIDIGAGNGALASAAADVGLQVTAIDISPEMVQRLRERLAAHPTAQAAQMDAEALDIDDAAFDIAISLFGATCCSDWQKSLSEMVRVTVDGGRLVIGHWEHPHGPRAMQLLIEVMGRVCPDACSTWHPPAHDTESLSRDLQQAGCRDVEIASARRTTRWPHIDRFVEEIDPLFRYSPDYAALDAEGRDRLAVPLREAFMPYADPSDGIVKIEDVALIASATAR